MICTVHIQACSKPLPSLPRLFQLRRATRFLILPSKFWMQHSSHHRRISGTSSASIYFNKLFGMTKSFLSLLMAVRSVQGVMLSKVPNFDTHHSTGSQLNTQNTRDRKCTGLADSRRNHVTRTRSAAQMAGQKLDGAWPCTSSGGWHDWEPSALRHLPRIWN